MQPSRWMDSLSEGVFLDGLNEVEEDVVSGVRRHRERDLTEPREVSFNVGVRNEPRMLQTMSVESRMEQSRDNFKNSTWRGPRAPQRPTTTTRRHKMRSVHNRKVVIREQDVMVFEAWK